MRPVLVGGGVALVVLVAAGVAAGYHLGRKGPSPRAPAHLAATVAQDDAQVRVIVDRVGTLAGRLTRLESEAAALATRMGAAQGTTARNAAAQQAPAPTAPGLEPRGRSRAPTSTPSGGPLVPLAGMAAPALLPDGAGDDFGIGLARLESQLERLETEVADMADLAAEHELASMAFPYRLPVAGRNVTSGYGVRRDPFTGRLARHTGLDIPAPRGTPILASGGGRVRSAGYNGAYGNTVIIDHGDGLSTLYGHAAKLFVRRGDIVLPNQKIAVVGSTGRSTGPHLHFEVIRDGRRVEPRQFLASVLAGKDAR